MERDFLVHLPPSKSQEETNAGSALGFCGSQPYRAAWDGREKQVSGSLPEPADSVYAPNEFNYF